MLGVLFSKISNYPKSMMEKRIINIEIATRAERWVTKRGSVSRESVGRGMEIWRPRFDFFSCSRPELWSSLPKLECVGGQQGCGTDLRRPHLVSNGSYRLEGNAGSRVHSVEYSPRMSECTPIHPWNMSRRWIDEIRSILRWRIVPRHPYSVEEYKSRCLRESIFLSLKWNKF